MFRDVLIATDGSEVATTAAAYGIAIATKFDATIHAVSVVESGENVSLEAISQERRTACREHVEAIEDEASDRDVSVVTNVRAGRPARELLDDAEANDVDLLALGTHGRTGVRRWLTGSVAATVIREAEAPVLTANASVSAPRREFDDIAVATDGRQGSKAPTDLGLDLAEAYGATVHAVYVVNEARSHMRVVLEEFERVGEEATTEVDDRAAARGLDAVRAIERGVPHEAIVDYVGERGVDLLVTGTESRSRVERLAMGSVSQRLVSGAPVPVLTVRSSP